MTDGTAGWRGPLDHEAASDPATAGVELARIAASRPDLRPALAANPATYPALLEWLAALHDPAVDAALRSRLAAPAAAAAPATPVAPVAPATPVAPVAPSWSPEPTWSQPTAPAPAAWSAQPGAPVDPAWSAQDAAPAWSAQTAAPAWSAQTAAPAWSAQPGAPVDPAWSGSPTWSTQSAEPPVPTRRRTGLWIAIAAVLVVLIGGGVAFYLLVLSKLGGAATPEAAATGFVQSLAAKDLLATYGMLSPAEVGSLSDAARGTRSSEAPQEVQDQMTALLDSVTITVDNLQTRADEIDTGLTKVEITDGTLTVDGDPEAIADAVMNLARSYTDQLPAGEGTLGTDLEASRAELVDTLSAKLPYTVDLADDVAVDGEAPFVMTVQEGGHWYVSPLMTAGEYVTVLAHLERGAMPDPADRARSASPVEAATAYSEALAALDDLNVEPLVATLPTAERRFVSVYVAGWLSDLRDKADGSVRIDATSSDFALLDQERGRARVVATDVGYDIDVDGEGGSFSFDGDCFAVSTQSGESLKGCLSDLPLAASLGFEQLPLVTVQEDGGWYVSLIETSASLGATVSENMTRLSADGSLQDPDWWTEQVPQDWAGGLVGDQACAIGGLCDEASSYSGTSSDSGSSGSTGTGSSTAWNDDTWWQDPVATAWYDECLGGTWTSCDGLYLGAEPLTELSVFASTCGYVSQTETYGECVSAMKD